MLFIGTFVKLRLTNIIQLTTHSYICITNQPSNQPTSLWYFQCCVRWWWGFWFREREKEGRRQEAKKQNILVTWLRPCNAALVRVLSSPKSSLIACSWYQRKNSNTHTHTHSHHRKQANEPKEANKDESVKTNTCTHSYSYKPLT